MKIFLIGSTQYLESKMVPDAEKLKAAGHDVLLPVMDSDVFLRSCEKPELALMTTNRTRIKWADVIYVYWDGRSPGTWGDICASFALGKPVKISYLEPMSCQNFLLQYAKEQQ